MSSKIKFTSYRQQSRMVVGVSVPIEQNGLVDFDELLREVVRVALRMDPNPMGNDPNPMPDWDDLYTRIRDLADAYIDSPEGEGEPASVLMGRLAAAIADAIPLSVRKTLINQPWAGEVAS